MGKVFIVTLPDSRVAVTRLAPGVAQAAALTKTLAALGATGPYQEIDEALVPRDRTYREAWEKDGAGGIRLNAVKKASLAPRKVGLA